MVVPVLKYHTVWLVVVFLITGCQELVRQLAADGAGRPPSGGAP